jgi:hypothetical protein
VQKPRSSSPSSCFPPAPSLGWSNTGQWGGRRKIATPQGT